MNLADLIRNGIAQAADVAGELRAEVIHTPATGEGTYAATSGDPVTRLALVEDEIKPVRMGDGIDRLSMAHLTFLEPVTVTEHDTFTLPNGRTWPVLRSKALLDPNGEPYMTEVWLGS
jgi:hypothetical protein